MSARRQKTSEEGQDMRNPWHHTQLRARTEHMLCVQFIAGGGCCSLFDVIALLVSVIIVNLSFILSAHN